MVGRLRLRSPAIRSTGPPQRLTSIFIRSTVIDCLEIKNCDSIRHLGIISRRGGIIVSTKLNLLVIDDCKNLVSLCNYEEEMADQLERLPEECIASASSSSTSSVVEQIIICKCPNLKRLPDSLHSLTNLTKLELKGCDGLEWFPESGLPIPNLKSLLIDSCVNIKSVPKNMHSLTSLEELKIWGCPGVEFLTEEQAGCLPPNLIDLEIRECSNMKQSMSEWGLDKLTSFQLLSIGGVSDELPEDEATLTTSLHLSTSLRKHSISDFKKMETITSTSWGIQNLTSLMFLSLEKCPKLRYLPKKASHPHLKSYVYITVQFWQRNAQREKDNIGPKSL